MSDEKLEKYFRQARESKPVYKREDAKELISNIPAGGEGFMSNIFTKIKGSPMTFAITGIAALTTAVLLFINQPSDDNITETPVSEKKTEIVDNSNNTNELKVKESKVSEEGPQEIAEAIPVPKKEDAELKKGKKINLITENIDVKNINTLQLDEKTLLELGVNREDGKLSVNTHENILYTIYKSGAKERRELEPNELMGYPEVSMITTANGMRVLEIFSNDGTRAIVDRRVYDNEDDKNFETNIEIESNLTDDENFIKNNFGAENKKQRAQLLLKMADKIENGELKQLDDFIINIMTTYLDNNEVDEVPDGFSSMIKSFYEDSVKDNPFMEQLINKEIAKQLRETSKEFENMENMKVSDSVDPDEVAEIIKEMKAKNEQDGNAKFFVQIQKKNEDINKIIADDTNLSEEDKQKIRENFNKDGKQSMVFMSNVKVDTSVSNKDGKTIQMDLKSLKKNEKVKFVQMEIDDDVLKEKIKNGDFEWVQNNLKNSNVNIEEELEIEDNIKLDEGMQKLNEVLSKTSEIFATKLEHDINKLIPVSVDVDGGEDDFILWYKASDVFLSKLPENVKERLAPELAALSEGASCGSAPVEKDQALTDAWSGCSGVVKNMKVFPNPIKNSVVNTEFNLDKNRIVSAAVYDLSGKKVKDLVVNENMGAGQYQESYEINGLNPGLYYLVISTEIGEQALQRIVIE